MSEQLCEPRLELKDTVVEMLTPAKGNVASA